VAFLALCDGHDLPKPLVNHPLTPTTTVDFVFPDHRVAVETDSWRGTADDRPSSATASATRP
jgi:hypothetical protein